MCKNISKNNWKWNQIGPKSHPPRFFFFFFFLSEKESPKSFERVPFETAKSVSTTFSKWFQWVDDQMTTSCHPLIIGDWLPERIYDHPVSESGDWWSSNEWCYQLTPAGDWRSSSEWLRWPGRGTPGHWWCGRLKISLYLPTNYLTHPWLVSTAIAQNTCIISINL